MEIDREAEREMARHKGREREEGRETEREVDRQRESGSPRCDGRIYTQRNSVNLNFSSVYFYVCFFRHVINSSLLSSLALFFLFLICLLFPLPLLFASFLLSSSSSLFIFLLLPMARAAPSPAIAESVKSTVRRESKRPYNRKRKRS